MDMTPLQVGYWRGKFLPQAQSGTPSTIILLHDETWGHDDVIKWKDFPRYWPFVRGIHRSPVNSPHKGQWRGALVFSLICVWINGCVNNCEAGDLRRYCAHYDVGVMDLDVMLLWLKWRQVNRSIRCNNKRFAHLCATGHNGRDGVSNHQSHHYSTVYSGADQRKYPSSASLSVVRGIHQWPVNSPHKGPVTRKMFPYDDVIIGTAIIWLSRSWYRTQLN